RLGAEGTRALGRRDARRMARTQSRIAAYRVARRRAAPFPGKSADARAVSSAQEGHRRGLAAPDRAAPEPGRRIRDRGVLLPLAQGTGTVAAHAASASLREPSPDAGAGSQVIECTLAMGQLQSPRR